MNLKKKKKICMLVSIRGVYFNLNIHNCKKKYTIFILLLQWWNLYQGN